MTHTNSTPANPIPPGWPDPLESPQAEAIRNGKLDDTEIRNLFDCMERELRLHRERAANPSQGVSDEMVEAALNSWFDGEIPVSFSGDFRADMRAALTAAIGAGGQAVAGTPHPLGPKQTIISEVWERLERQLCRNIDRAIIEQGVETALHILRREGITLRAHPTPSEQAVAFASRQSGILDFDVNGAEIINVLLHPKGTLRPGNEIPLYAHPVNTGWRECATDGCVSPATIHFVRGGVGSYYCYSCYCKIQALPAGRAALADGGRDAD